MSPLRYCITKLAHERNPYPRDSEGWRSFNDGFIETAMPSWPSRWEVAVYLMQVGYALTVLAAVGALAVFLIRLK